MSADFIHAFRSSPAPDMDDSFLVVVWLVSAVMLKTPDNNRHDNASLFAALREPIAFSSTVNSTLSSLIDIRIVIASVS